VILRLRRQSAGQSFVEFALILPIILMLLLMAADLGRVFLAVVTLNNTARVGARYAAANPGATYSQGTYEGQINNEWADIDCDKQSPIPGPVYSGTQIGDSVTVTLQCTFHVLTPLISNIVGSGLVVTSQAVLPVTSCDLTSGSTTNSICLAPPTAPPVTPPPPTAPPCLAGAPSVAISPNPQNGSHGAKRSYTVDITNNDTLACLPRDLAISAAAAFNPSSAWVITIPSTINLAPATSGSVTLDVTADPDPRLKDGTYNINVTVDTVTKVAQYVIPAPAPCVTNNPSIAFVIPPGASQGAPPGTALTYSVTVTNNDTGTCAPRSLTISFSQPNGWQLPTASPASVTLDPGNSAQSDITIQSPATAQQGPYNTDIKLSATIKVVATYVVGPCMLAVPGLSANPTSRTAPGGQTVDYTVTLTNNDPPCAAPRDFVLSVGALPNGFTSNYPVTLKSVAPGATPNSTLQVTSQPGTPINTYTIQIKAASPPTADATPVPVDYVIPPCSRSDPSLTVLPVTQTGNGGDTLTYAVTVTNNDSQTCANRTFDLSLPTPPSNWTWALSAANVTLAPGASSPSSGPNAIKLTAKSPGTAEGISQDVTVTVSSAPTADVPKTVKYVIPGICTAKNPTVTATPATQTSPQTGSVQYIVTVTNNDTGSACAPRSFTLSVSGNPAKTTWAFAPASPVSVAPGQTSANITLTVTATGAKVGTYTLTITATGGGTSGSAPPVTYKVQ
jgi:uncharacterized membrane protein